MRIRGRLPAMFLLLALAVSVACSGGIGGCASRREGGFAAFRERRLSLPETVEPVMLVAVGDVMLSRGVAGEIERSGDIQHPFRKMSQYLQAGDIVFGNLECPLTPGPKVGIREMALRADPELGTALAASGFTVLSLANNHVPDSGPEGIRDTIQNLREAGVEYVGAGEDGAEARSARYVTVKGMRLAFLAYTDPSLVPPSYEAGPSAPCVSLIDMETMPLDIRKASENADFVVVSIHAGTEYSAEPDSSQIEYARTAIDAGADLVLGHHPHVVQRVERYRNGYIFYSLGNFVFDQMWSRETREGVAVRLYLGRSGLERIEYLPSLINGAAQPEALSGDQAEVVMQRLGPDVEVLPVVMQADTESGDEEGPVPVRYVTYCLRPASEARLAKVQESDLDGDGIAERYELRDGRLAVHAGSHLVWESPGEWWVDRFVLGDANNDGVHDLNMSVWKAGSFGRHRPFWVKEDDQSVRNHLFIFDIVHGVPKAVWQSSNLDRPNYDMSLEDLDGDGRNELFTLEGDYSDPGVTQMGVWRWNGWGFSRVLRDG